ncbi:hypothetical protein L3081_05910 [Colwellia sp. MSW7]|uniref:Uncharacterized protein n=1 Tax=Colwellia maritima TaxID=2912588 RepID=A0ABS9WYK7_9GAMM|nr:hypothetical protein [Colwellia maritima]MCI2283015.1 hypothetical protein [Colwellia maritima]
MNKKNCDTLNQQSTAEAMANNNKKQVKRQLKIERFAELLLQSGLSGVTRWSIVGKQQSNNPGTFASDLRKIGLNITKGRVYTLVDLISAKAGVNFINKKRAERNAELLEHDVIEHWLQPFIARENEVES